MSALNHPRSRPALLQLYKRLLRAAETFPSKNRIGIYQSIREEWKINKSLEPNNPKLDKKLAVAYKGLQQLRMYDEDTMTGGNIGSPNWSVTLEQNPMPKPADYDDRKKKEQNKRSTR